MPHSTLSTQARHALYMRLLLRLSGLALLCWLLGGHFGDLCSIALPFLLAYLLAKALNIVVTFASERFQLSRKWLSMLCVFVLLLLLWLLIFQLCRRLSQEVEELLADWDGIRSSLIDSVSVLSATLQRLPGMEEATLQTAGITALQSALNWLETRMADWSEWMVGQMGNVASRMLSVLISAMMFFAASGYFTTEFPALQKKWQSDVPASLRTRLHILRQAVVGAAGGYWKAQTILSGFVCFFLLLAFWIYGQAYAVLLSLLIAVVDFIPILGSGTVMVPWAIWALLRGEHGKFLFLIALWCFLFLFRKAAEPKILGNQTGLSTLASLICIYVGMKLGGVAGMIFAPIICLVLLRMAQAGAFANLAQDFRMLLQDLQQTLGGPGKQA